MLYIFMLMATLTSCSSDNEFYTELMVAEISENKNAEPLSDNSTIDRSLELQTALDKGGLVKLDNKIYTINKPLNLNVSGTELDLNGATITSSTIFRLVNINVNSIEDNFTFVIRNGNFSSTVDTGLAARDLFGLITIDNKDVENGRFEKLNFTNPSSATNAIKVIASVNGSAVKNLFFKDITVENCGQMGLEINSHNNDYNFVNYVGNVFIENFNAKNLGTKSIYGMGLSISGNIHNTEWIGGSVTGFKDRGIENAGGRIFKVSNVKVINPVDSKDEFIGVSDGAGSGKTNYSSNFLTVFNNMYIEGGGAINLTSDEKDILISNSVFNGNIRFDNRNVEYIDNIIKTSNLFLTFSGKHVSVKGGSIDFGLGVSRFAIGGGTLNLEDTKITKEDDEQLVDVTQSSVLNCIGSSFTNGYIQSYSGSVINLNNVEYTSGLGNEPFRGNGLYTKINVIIN